MALLCVVHWSHIRSKLPRKSCLCAWTAGVILFSSNFNPAHAVYEASPDALPRWGPSCSCRLSVRAACACYTAPCCGDPALPEPGKPALCHGVPSTSRKAQVMWVLRQCSPNRGRKCTTCLTGTVTALTRGGRAFGISCSCLHFRESCPPNWKSGSTTVTEELETSAS